MRQYGDPVSGHGPAFGDTTHRIGQPLFLRGRGSARDDHHPDAIYKQVLETIGLGFVLDLDRGERMLGLIDLHQFFNDGTKTLIGTDPHRTLIGRVGGTGDNGSAPAGRDTQHQSDYQPRKPHTHDSDDFFRPRMVRQPA